MFTGIVEEIGTVAGTSTTGLSIGASVVMDDLKVSDSICVNGACLTVTDHQWSYVQRRHGARNATPHEPWRVESR